MTREALAKAVATAGRAKARLRNMMVQEVSLVDHAANRRRWLIKKADDTTSTAFDDFNHRALVKSVGEAFADADLAAGEAIEALRALRTPRAA